MDSVVRISFNGQQIGPFPWTEGVFRCCADDVSPAAQVYTETDGWVSAQLFLAANLKSITESNPGLVDQAVRDCWVRYSSEERGPLLFSEWIRLLCAPNAPLDAEFKSGEYPYTPLFETLKGFTTVFLQRATSPPAQDLHRTRLQRLLSWIVPPDLKKPIRVALVVLYLLTPFSFLVAKSLFQDGTATLMGIHQQRNELLAEKDSLEKREQQGSLFGSPDYSREKQALAEKIERTGKQIDLIRDARMPWINFLQNAGYAGLLVFFGMIGRRLLQIF